MLGWIDIETNAIAFAKRWKDCEGNERQEAQSFEKDLMSVFGVDWLEGLHEYQVYDAEGKMGYIDYLLPGKILIEMKSKGESLIRAYNQGYDYAKCLKPEDISDKQKESIEKTAQEVLDARALYPESSLADLYDPLLMPSELIKAHNRLDKAVIDAYGGAGFKSEAERVADLMQRYERLTEQTKK